VALLLLAMKFLGNQGGEGTFVQSIIVPCHSPVACSHMAPLVALVSARGCCSSCDVPAWATVLLWLLRRTSSAAGPCSRASSTWW